MNEDKVETREVFLPMCLMAAKLLRVFEVREVLVIHQDSERMGSTFEIVTPFLESVDDGKKLAVINIIVAFCIVKGTRHESNQMPIAIHILLTKNGTGSKLGGISFELERVIVIRSDEDRGGGK